MKMTKKLYKLVVEEANNIKKYATPVEIEILEPGCIIGNNEYECIYGQMTGHCNNPRALELISKCAGKVSAGEGRWVTSSKVNDKTRYGRNWAVHRDYYSPIELALFDLHPTDQRAIVKYIKGETDSLEFFYEKNYK